MGSFNENDDLSNLDTIIEETNSYFKDYNNFVWNLSHNNKFRGNNVPTLDLEDEYFIDTFFFKESLIKNNRISGFEINTEVIGNEKISRITIPKITIPEFKVGLCPLDEVLNENELNKIIEKIKDQIMDKLRFRLTYNKIAEVENRGTDYSNDGFEEILDYPDMSFIEDVINYYIINELQRIYESNDNEHRLENPFKGISTDKLKKKIKKETEKLKPIKLPDLDPGKAIKLPSIKLPPIKLPDLDPGKTIKSPIKISSPSFDPSDLNLIEKLKKELDTLNKKITDQTNQISNITIELDWFKKAVTNLEKSIGKIITQVLQNVKVPCISARKSIIILGLDAKYPVDYSNVFDKILDIAQKSAMAEMSMVVAISIPAIIGSAGSAIPGVIATAATRGVDAFRQSITSSLQLINENPLNNSLIHVEEIKLQKSGDWMPITNPYDLAKLLE